MMRPSATQAGAVIAWEPMLELRRRVKALDGAIGIAGAPFGGRGGNQGDGMLPRAGGRPVEVAKRGNLTRRRQDRTHRTREDPVGAIAGFGEPNRQARGVEPETYRHSTGHGFGGHGMTGFADGGPVRRQHSGPDQLPAQNPLSAGDVRPPPIGRRVEQDPFGARTEVPRVDDVRRRSGGPVSADQDAPAAGHPRTRREHVIRRRGPGADRDGLVVQDRRAQPEAVLGELRRREPSTGQHQ